MSLNGMNWSLTGGGSILCLLVSISMGDSEKVRDKDEKKKFHYLNRF